MVKPIAIGEIHFKKKGDAVEFFRTMLNKYYPGDKVSKDDAIVLMAAVQKHPDASQKIGCGVTHFSVRTADFGTQCFWVNRTDGTTEKFAIGKCLN